MVLALFSATLVGFGGGSPAAAASGPCMGYISEGNDAAKKSFQKECGREWNDQIRDQCTWVSNPGQGWVCHEYAPNGVSNPKLPGNDDSGDDGSSYVGAATERKFVGSTNADSYWSDSRMRNAKDIGTDGTSIKHFRPETRTQPPPQPESQGIPSILRKRTGRLYMKTPAGDARCTASVVDTPGGNVIWTAGHCLHQDGQWNTMVTFVPEYEPGNEPHGKWAATELFSLTHWTEHSAANSDLGVVVLETKNGQSITDVVGGNPILFDQSIGTKIHGVAYENVNDRQVDCLSTFEASYWLKNQASFKCEPLTPGSSGSGLFTRTSNGAQALVGIATNCQLKDSDVCWSPIFHQWAKTLYNDTKYK